METSGVILQSCIPLLVGVACANCRPKYQSPILLCGWIGCLVAGSRFSVVVALVASAHAIRTISGQFTARHPVLLTLTTAALASCDAVAFFAFNSIFKGHFETMDSYLQQWLHPSVFQWLMTGSLEDSNMTYQVQLDMHTYAAQLAFDEAKPWLFGLLSLHPLVYLPPAAAALAASPAHALLAGYTLVTCLSAGTPLREWVVVVSLMAVLFRKNAFRERRWGTALAACLHLASSVLFAFTQYLWETRRTGNPNFIFFQADILIFTSFVMVTRVLVDYMHEATLSQWLRQAQKEGTLVSSKQDPCIKKAKHDFTSTMK